MENIDPLDNTKNPKVWVVIPALNEEKSLQWLLPKVNTDYSVVVVDNASTDATFEVAKSHNAYAVSCAKRGYGIAVQTGVNYLTSLEDPIKDSDTLIILDADGTSPITYISRLIQNIKNGSKDLAIAQRRELEKNSMSCIAKWGNKLQVRLIGLLTGYYYEDMGPLRAMKYGIYKKLKMTDRTWGWNVEMQINAAVLNMRMDEFPITYEERRFGRSKISGSFIGAIRAGTKIVTMIFYYFLKARFTKLGAR